VVPLPNPLRTGVASHDPFCALSLGTVTGRATGDGRARGSTRRFKEREVVVRAVSWRVLEDRICR
jgi:hypothetical protein